MIAELLRTRKAGVIQKGAFTRMAAIFKSRLLDQQALRVHKSGAVVGAANLRSKRKCGRKRVNLESLTAAIPEVPLKDRTTQRTFAAALGLSLIHI